MYTRSRKRNKHRGNDRRQNVKTARVNTSPQEFITSFTGSETSGNYAKPKRASSSSRRVRPHRSNFRPRNSRRKVFNVEQFLSQSQPVVARPTQEVEAFFQDFSFEEPLLKNIGDRNFISPTPIQSQAIPSILEGNNLLGIANTGTGKTGAFLMPLINKVISDREQKILVLAPTRELAVQIEKELYLLTKNLGIKSVLVIGGTSMRKQERRLKKNFDFVIGTPGRIKDMHAQGHLQPHIMQTVVLDEVDRMLDMGFVHDVSHILSQMPVNRQSLYFSATMSNRVTGLIQQFSSDVHTVSVKSQEIAHTITQDVVKIGSHAGKLETLHDILIQTEVEKVLIFGRTKRGVHRLSRELADRGFRAESIHGDKSQPQRQRALTRFRLNKVNILVATDVAARGIDVDDITHVINYDQPESYDDYVHRIGRTGRANRKGTALTFV